MKRKALYSIVILSLVGVLTASFSLFSPPPSIGPYFNGVFPKTPPGKGGSWTVVDEYPDFDIISPLRIIPYPLSDDYLVLSKAGLVWKVNFDTHQKSLLLDISDRTFNLGEGGSVGLVLHPDFGTGSNQNQYIFIFYRTKPNPAGWSELGYNRLSKFSWDASRQEFEKDSEEILFQQFDRATWHNGGGMFFRPDGFLYVSVGDEGFEEFKEASNQRLDRGFFGGLLRIDVDNDSTRSHAIRRQPRVSEAPPEGWFETFSKGYLIPNDNPWLDEDGAYLEEFYALGIRSPYSTFYDSLTDQIWILDVGYMTREEISILEKGDNLQWPFMEGSTPSESFARPNQILGNEKAPIFEYGRDIGNCIIGGGIYYGEKFLDLHGKFLLADYSANKLMALEFDDNGGQPTLQTLIPNIKNLSLDLPEDPGITGIHILRNGEVLMTIIGKDHKKPGKILKLQQKEVIPDPPRLLSELGIFNDLQTLEVTDGIIPYQVNSPLWSDRATKQRWMIIPNKSGNLSTFEKIIFNENSDWIFPKGSVFIKQFNLPLSTDGAGPVFRLETRFFIVAKEGQSYGLTYKWNDEGTDAELLRIGASKSFDIFNESGDFAYQQIWEYPSRDQCLRCHTKNSNFVLGVKTHQLNGDQKYADVNQPLNQLTYLSEKGIFDKEIEVPDRMIKSYALTDHQISLETRIRSYWDANCAFCHLTGGIPNVSLNMPFTIPIQSQNIINLPTSSMASDPNRYLIETGDHAQSELWIRDASSDDNKMPPIGRNLIDQIYIDSLAKWIDGLPADFGKITELQLFPNPASDFISVRISDNWDIGHYQFEIFDLTGKVLQQFSTTNASQEINLSNLPAGIYILRAKSNQNQMEERKFFIN